MKVRIASFLMLLLSTAAVANTEAGAPPAGMPGGPGGGPAPIMFRAGGMGTIAMAGYDLHSIGIAYLPFDHVMVAAALSFQYNGNDFFTSPLGGVVVPGATGYVKIPGTWESGILLAIEYMIVDRMPFAMGPAFAFRGSFAPGDFFQSVTLIPAWDLWYTPFNAPIAIGTALAMTITLTRGAEPIISLMTPGLRLAYTF